MLKRVCRVNTRMCLLYTATAILYSSAFCKMGRLVPPPRLDGKMTVGVLALQGGSVHRYSPTTADFSREIREHRMHVSVSLDSWHVVCPKRDSRACNDFVKQLIDVGRPIGVAMNLPKITLLEDDRASSYVRGLRDSNGMQMVLLVASNNRKDRYDLIKKQACCEIGIPTQVAAAQMVSAQFIFPLCQTLLPMWHLCVASTFVFSPHGTCFFRDMHQHKSQLQNRTLSPS